MSAEQHSRHGGTKTFLFTFLATVLVALLAVTTVGVAHARAETAKAEQATSDVSKQKSDSAEEQAPAAEEPEQSTGTDDVYKSGSLEISRSDSEANARNLKETCASAVVDECQAVTKVEINQDEAGEIVITAFTSVDLDTDQTDALIDAVTSWYEMGGSPFGPASRVNLQEPTT